MTPSKPVRPASAKGRSRRARRRRRRAVRHAASLLLSAVLLAAVVSLAWWGTLTPPVPPSPVSAVNVLATTTDTPFVCPAAPRNTLGAVALGQTTSTTTITPLPGASALSWGQEELDTSAPTVRTDGEGGTLHLVAGEVAGQDSPAGGVVGVSTTLTPDGDLRGLTAAPCSPASAISWFVGGSTALGSSAELRMTNPGTTTVKARVSLYGSTGRLALPSNGELTVPAGQTVALLLETAGAADDRVALSVEADGGTIVPVLVTESLDGETPAGTEVLTRGAAPSTSLSVPGVVLVEPENQGERSDAQTSAVSAQSPAVRVVNPGTEAATVSVSLLGAAGQEALPGAEQVVIDPGAVFDISLGGVAPGHYAVRVTSDAPVSAAVRLVRSAGEYPARSGALAHDIAWVQATTPGTLDSATLAVPREQGLSPVVVLSNSSARDAALTLGSADGSWTQEITVPAWSTLTPEIPQGVTALTLSGQDVDAVSAAAVVTVSVQGDVSGELIAVIPAVPDAAALSGRPILLR